MNINSVTSLFHKAEVKVEEVASEIKADVEGVFHKAEADTSRVIHSVEVKALAVGKDITVRFDSAVGEVKRIVINGETTVEGLIAHLRGLA
jgi:hypothetical protein